MAPAALEAAGTNWRPIPSQRGPSTIRLCPRAWSEHKPVGRTSPEQRILIDCNHVLEQAKQDLDSVIKPSAPRSPFTQKTQSSPRSLAEMWICGCRTLGQYLAALLIKRPSRERSTIEIWR